MLAAIELLLFTALLSISPVLGTRRNSGQFLFLARFFASSHFGSISESVVFVGDPEHDRLGRPVFHGISKHTHLLTSLTPMIGVIGQEAWHKRRVVIGHRNTRAE